MSDIVLGAIIGIVGALIGAGITGYFTYRIGKLQIDARSTEQKQQFEYQEREARKSRLVESRKQYLIPLRETVSKWAAELTRMIDLARSMGMALQIGYGASSYQSKGESKGESKGDDFEAIVAQMKACKKDLEVLQGQVHDEELNDAIDTVLFEEVEVRLVNFVTLFPEYHGWLNDNDKAKHTEDLNAALDRARDASIELREHLQRANKRIEELLVGDEA